MAQHEDPRVTEGRRLRMIRLAALADTDDEADGGLGEADAGRVERRIAAMRRRKREQWARMLAELVACIRVVRDPRMHIRARTGSREE